MKTMKEILAWGADRGFDSRGEHHESMVVLNGKFGSKATIDTVGGRQEAALEAPPHVISSSLDLNTDEDWLTLEEFLSGVGLPNEAMLRSGNETHDWALKEGFTVVDTAVGTGDGHTGRPELHLDGEPWVQVSLSSKSGRYAFIRHYADRVRVEFSHEPEVVNYPEGSLTWRGSVASYLRGEDLPGVMDLHEPL
jgi:hypothetical protein